MDEEEKKSDAHEHGKLPGHSKKESKLLWWGLGIGAAGLVATLLLFKSGGSQDGGGQTAVNAPAAMVPNPQNPFDASVNDYWPYAPQAPSPVPSPGGGTTTHPGGSSGGKKKKKKSGEGSSSGGSVSPHHTKNNFPKEPKVSPDPTFGGAHGWIYTTGGGETLGGLSKQWWGNQGSFNFLTGYANNRQLLQSEGLGNAVPNTILPAGKKIIA